jgi:hypothetical protein
MVARELVTVVRESVTASRERVTCVRDGGVVVRELVRPVRDGVTVIRAAVTVVRDAVRGIRVPVRGMRVPVNVVRETCQPIGAVVTRHYIAATNTIDASAGQIETVLPSLIPAFSPRRRGNAHCVFVNTSYGIGWMDCRTGRKRGRLRSSPGGEDTGEGGPKH